MSPAWKPVPTRAMPAVAGWLRGHWINQKLNIDYVVSMGVYVFEPRVLEDIPENQYPDFPDLVLKLIAAGEKVISFPFTGYWKDLGRPGRLCTGCRGF